jgi:hypothetical protein
VFQYVVMKVPNDVLGLSFGPVVVLFGRPQFRPKMFLRTAISTTESMTVMLIRHVQFFQVHQSHSCRGLVLFASIDSPPKSLSTT